MAYGNRHFALLDMERRTMASSIREVLDGGLKSSDTQMTQSMFVFECSSNTYLDCVSQNLFGSNKPWPLEIKAGDYCLLHHYEIRGLLGLWQATSDGGRNLAPKLWNGKFPFQVRVKLLTPQVAEVPRAVLAEHGMNPATGRFDASLDDDLAEEVIQAMIGND